MRTTRSLLLIIGAGVLFAFFLVIAQGPAPEAASDVPSKEREVPIPANETAQAGGALELASRVREVFSTMFVAPAIAGEGDETLEGGGGTWMSLPAQFVAQLSEEESRSDEPLEYESAAATDQGARTEGQGPEMSGRTSHERYVRAVIALRAGKTHSAVAQLEDLLDAFAGDRMLRADVRMNLARAQIALARNADDATTSDSGVRGTGVRGAPDGAIRGDGSVARPGIDAAPSRRGAHVRQALSLSEEALALAPSSDEAWNVRGLALLSAQRAAEAIAAFEKAIAIDPSNVHAQNNLGYVRILRGDHAGAVAPLRAGREASLRLGIDPPAHLLNNLGVALEATGAFAEAGEAFRAAAAAGHPHASVSLARVEELVPRGDRIASSAETLAVR